MKIIKPSFEILTVIDGPSILKSLELAGRTCYKSEDKITDDSAQAFVTKLINSGHEAMIEHFSISVKIICDRGVSHEIVRHRLASYAQESTRYCNYSLDKFGREITVIIPCFWPPALIGSNVNMDYWEEFMIWKNSCLLAEKAYFELLDHGATPQQARSVLPNSLKTEIVVTMNLREWRHFFRLRTALTAHPQMREIANPILVELQKHIPVIFDDLKDWLKKEIK